MQKMKPSRQRAGWPRYPCKGRLLLARCRLDAGQVIGDQRPLESVAVIAEKQPMPVPAVFVDAAKMCLSAGWVVGANQSVAVPAKKKAAIAAAWIGRLPEQGNPRRHVTDRAFFRISNVMMTKRNGHFFAQKFTVFELR
ncbi:hypothetical protein ACFFJT_10835 [Dyella flava]|uniref:Uncharacterized protein n=1 Tax=Dyella flava TaxID=1920170 RepID=A0ABS2JYS9_9GAMM|nr:hypothetical protein [Dyella flava]MBM7123935.1 hypothetical protein [Dyella flava]